MKLLKHPADNFIFRGSTVYLPDRNTPVDSPAARRIAELAREAHAEGENLWVMAIGAITNVASALLLDPEIAGMITVVWLGGHPAYWFDNKEFNLYQDVPAAQVIFESGVPFVQIPCITVAELLLIGPEELRTRCLPTGPLGAFLANRVFDELALYNGHSRTIWDISAPGYFLVPEAFTCEIVSAPELEDGSGRCRAVPGQHEMKLVRHINRDPVFDKLFELLKLAPQ